MTKKNPKVDAIVAASGVDVVELGDTRRQAVELCDFLEAVPCETAQQEQWCSQQRASVGALLKRLEEERMKVKRPMLDAGKAVDALFKPATDPLKRAEGILLAKLQGAAQRRLELAAEAEKAAEEAAVAGDALAVIEAAAAIPEKVETEGSITGWKYEAVVVDKDAVPERWKIVDVDNLNAFAADAKQQGCWPETVPGIEFRKVAVIRRKGG